MVSVKSDSYSLMKDKCEHTMTMVLHSAVKSTVVVRVRNAHASSADKAFSNHHICFLCTPAVDEQPQQTTVTHRQVYTAGISIEHAS